jgi:hypothetical protein
LAGYEIWYALYEGDQFYGGQASAGATGAVVDGLVPGREYRLWMKAFDEDGNRSIASAEVTATPLAAGDGDDDDDDNDDNDDNNDSDDGGRDSGASGDAHDQNSVGVTEKHDDDPAPAGCGGR